MKRSVAVRFIYPLVIAVTSLALAVGCSGAPEQEQEPQPQTEASPSRRSEGPGTLVGFVDDASHLWLRDANNAAAQWVSVANDVTDFQLVGWRVAARKKDGSVYLGTDPLAHPLELVDTHVAAYQLAINRVATLHDDGSLSLAEWSAVSKPMATGVRAVQVLVDRIGILGTDGDFWVQDGTSAQPYQKIASDVKAFQLEQEWIAYGTDAGSVMLGRGQIDGIAFLEQGTGARDFALDVWVDAEHGNESRARLAYVRGNTISVGQGHIERLVAGDHIAHLTMAPISVRGDSVHWAGGRLLAVNGTSVVGATMGNDGTLGTFEKVGSLTDTRWSMGGATLALPSTEKLTLRAGNDKQLNDAEFSLPGHSSKGAFEIASIRPLSTRRPAVLDGLGKGIPVAFVTNAEVGQ